MITDECWLYAGYISRDGYGTISIWHKNYGAHKVMYEQVHGELPESLVIDHLCRVRRCVNPEHMEAVTIKENVLRGEGISARNLRKTTCKNGHPFDGVSKQSHGGGYGRYCTICRKEWRKKYYWAKKSQVA